jgi:hypothetical protein
MLKNIIDTLPFFYSLDDQEKSDVETLFHEINIKSGDKINTQKGDHLYIVRDGYFQSEGALQRGETIFLSKGSVLGMIPFGGEPLRGSVKAVSNSRVIVAEADSLRRFFITRFIALRGYLNILIKTGFSCASNVIPVIKKKSKVIMVTGHEKGLGRSVTSLYIAGKLSEKESVVVCDLSQSGISIFDYCKKKLTPPISQKKAGDKGENYFIERIVAVNTKLSLINFSYGAKVDIDPMLLSPLLFYLSSKFSYIILDINNDDGKLEEEALKLSDWIIPVCRNEKEIARERMRYGSICGHGQNILCATRVTDGSNSSRNFISIPAMNFTIDCDYSYIVNVCRNNDDDIVNFFTARPYISMPTTGFTSLCYAGLLPHLWEVLESGATIYAHSFAIAFIAAMMKNGSKEYSSIVKNLFREEKIEALIKYSYPGKALIRKEPIVSWANSIVSTLYMDQFKSRIFSSLIDVREQKKIIGYGLIRDVIAGSFLDHPSAGKVKIQSGIYGGGEPLSGGFFFRHPVGNSISFSVNNLGIDIQNRRIHDAIKMGLGVNRDTGVEKWLYDRNIIIDVDLKRYNIKKILASTSQLWEKALSVTG